MKDTCNPQIHDTQDTFPIHVGYKGIQSMIRISSPNSYLRARGEDDALGTLAAARGEDDALGTLAAALHVTYM